MIGFLLGVVALVPLLPGRSDPLAAPPGDPGAAGRKALAPVSHLEIAKKGIFGEMFF